MLFAPSLIVPSRRLLTPAGCEIAVRKYSALRRQASEAEPHVVAGRIVGFLRARHGSKTAENVHAETGIPAKTVAKWMERASIPSGLAILRLTKVYGVEFLAALISAPWIDELARAEQLARADRAVADAIAARDRLRDPA